VPRKLGASQKHIALSILSNHPVGWLAGWHEVGWFSLLERLAGKGDKGGGKVEGGRKEKEASGRAWQSLKPGN
jgi:hypothetical protein